EDGAGQLGMRLVGLGRDHDVGAVARRAQRDCKSDAARCAGDEQGAAFECHDPSTAPFLEPRAAHSVCSPPPCGEGWGGGLAVVARGACLTPTPTPPASLRFGGRPSPQGGGARPTSLLLLIPLT